MVDTTEIDAAIEKMQRTLDDIQNRLARLEPLVEYAEQLLEQKARIAKWIPGKK